MSDYQAFLQSKRVAVASAGFDVTPRELNPALFPFQRDVTRWGLQLGKAALFEERGLGKTIQELEWAKQVAEHTGGRVLILAPLAVAFQAVDEAAKFRYGLKYAQSQTDSEDARIVVSNYERLDQFNPAAFSGIVLDESSILKAYSGKTKRALLEAFAQTPYKLAATATPAPNDHIELGNHAEFLGIMSSHDMLARWFINDTMQAGNYRLKRHAERDFWRWLTSWAVCISKPRDLGDEYDMPGFDLPPLQLHEHLVRTSDAAIARTFAEGRLLPDDSPSSTELHKVKRESLVDRVAEASTILSALSADEYVVLWCDTNYEADALREAFPDAAEVRGSDSQARKGDLLRAFSRGEIRRLITKPDIAGMGLNWQHCARAVYCGVSYSFEKFYQSVGRFWRYGQTRPVDAHLIYAATEGNVLETLKHKQARFAEMQAAMNEAMSENGLFRDGSRLARRTSVGAAPIQIPSWLKSHNPLGVAS